MSLQRLKNRLIARVITAFPSLAKGFIDAYHPWESDDVPWTAVTKPLADAKDGRATVRRIDATRSSSGGTSGTIGLL